MFYVCGPVRFTRSLLEEFERSNVPSENYRIVWKFKNSKGIGESYHTDTEIYNLG